MSSSPWTLVVLLVLWAVVVIPMLVRRRDARAQERSVREFGRAMRSLSKGPAREEMFVVGSSATRPAARPGSRSSAPPLAVRRPVPAAQEALMFTVDRAEMSAARARMMKRRRRSLSVLGLGSVVTLLLAFAVGGGLFWGSALLFLGGLFGYVYFLRTQALRDRERRANRQERATARRSVGYDATESEPEFAPTPESVVRIDDDDISLHNLDTVDLTGLYNEEGIEAPAAQRRAS